MVQTKMFSWLAGGLALSLSILLLPGTALANAKNEETMVMAGGYHLSLTFSAPAKVGRNSLRLKILDAMGMPVSGARVEISTLPTEDPQVHQENKTDDAKTMADMPGMSHAPATIPSHVMPGKAGMDAAATILLASEPSRQSGDYFGIIDFSEAGLWQLNTHLSINGQAVDAGFPVDVMRGSSALIILLGFFALNALIIWVASAFKSNPVTA